MSRHMLTAFVVAMVGASSCNSTSQGTGNGGGVNGGGGAGAGNNGASGAGGPGAGGTGGSRQGGTGGRRGDGENNGGRNGGGGPQTCTPGVEATLITDCGYPMASNLPLTSVVFSESEVLRAIEGSGGAPTATIKVFYNDEHALTLGVRQVVVKTAMGTTTTDYPVSPLSAIPGSALNPQTGSNELLGPQSGLDVSQRPMWPALYITDITSDPNDRSGDWQHGGRPHNPSAVFGTWKPAVRTVDATVTPNKIAISPDPDPMKNNWMLGPGSDPVPAGLTNQGFGAEARWSVPLASGHSYRLQAMVHDGDQNKAGGDSGQACVIFCAGGAVGPGPDAGVAPPPMCPAGTMRCGQDAIDPGACPSATVCANGCCLPIIP